MFQLRVVFAYLTLIFGVLGTTTKRNATYDDLEKDLVTRPLDSLYLGLNYSSWLIPNNLSESIPIRVGGLKTHSPKVLLLTARDSQFFLGTPFMTVVPPYKSFSPSDFWFGCVQRLRQSVVGLAAQCTINVAGFNANGQEVASAVYTFTPALDPTGQASMIHAILPDTFHVPLSKMTMIEDGLTSSLWIDNLIYDISN